MTQQQGAWIWYELVTPDADGSKAFYEAVVPGWSIQTTHGGGDGSAPGDKPYGFINNADGGMTGGVLHLNSDMIAHGARPMWLGYIAVDDTDAMVRQIEAVGGKTLMPANDVEMAGRIALMADCCGAPFYIMQPKPQPGQDGQASTAFSTTLPGRCSWNELMAGNAEKALSFYTMLFGWQRDLEPPMDIGEMGQYTFIAHNGEGIGAVMTNPPGSPGPMWNHYFTVGSIATAKAAVEANGGTIANGPMEVPGGQWILQGTDPQGAMFALVGAK